jgi:spore coat polysaccharide biosynthesis protein SpsF
VTGVFLQVRLSSTRLANKALLELGGYAVMEHAMRSLSRLPAYRHVVLTDEESASLLGQRAKRCGWSLFVGPRENVLERFVRAARAHGVDEIVRATGDNPLVSWELARMAVARRRRLDLDYFAFDGLPLGTGVEIVRARALETALRESSDPYDAEHVTPFLYRNPERFACCRLRAPGAYVAADARVTLDTADDYRELCAVFARYYDGSPIPILRLVRLLQGSSSATDDGYVYPSGA